MSCRVLTPDEVEARAKKRAAMTDEQHARQAKLAAQAVAAMYGPVAQVARQADELAQALYPASTARAIAAIQDQADEVAAAVIEEVNRRRTAREWRIHAVAPKPVWREQAYTCGPSRRPEWPNFGTSPTTAARSLHRAPRAPASGAPVDHNLTGCAVMLALPV